MSDQWSVPENQADGDWRTDRIHREAPFGLDAVSVLANDVDVMRVNTEDETHISVTRDAMLKVLAAEANDRVGWKWTVEYFTDDLCWVARCGSAAWTCYGKTGAYEFEPGIGGFGFDDVIAALHGKYLLEAARANT